MWWNASVHRLEVDILSYLILEMNTREITRENQIHISESIVWNILRATKATYYLWKLMFTFCSLSKCAKRHHHLSSKPTAVTTVMELDAFETSLHTKDRAECDQMQTIRTFTLKKWCLENKSALSWDLSAKTCVTSSAHADVSTEQLCGAHLDIMTLVQS